MTKKNTPEWILSAYHAGADMRQDIGPIAAEKKAQALRKRIRRGTSRRYSTRSTQAVIKGLLGQQLQGV